MDGQRGEQPINSGSLVTKVSLYLTASGSDSSLEFWKLKVCDSS